MTNSIAREGPACDGVLRMLEFPDRVEIRDVSDHVKGAADDVDRPAAGFQSDARVSVHRRKIGRADTRDLRSQAAIGDRSVPAA